MPQNQSEQDRLLRERIEANKRLELFLQDSDIDGMGTLTKYRGKEPNILLPKRVKSIGTGAFVGCHFLKTITFHENVWSIGNWSFVGCTSLTSVTIPDSVTDIGSSAFQDCTSLREANISAYCNVAEGAFPRATRITRRPAAGPAPSGPHTPSSGVKKSPTAPAQASRLGELLDEIEFNIACGDFEGNQFVNGARELLEVLFAEIPRSEWIKHARVYWAMLMVEYKAETDEALLPHYNALKSNPSYKKACTCAEASDPALLARIRALDEAHAAPRRPAGTSTSASAPDPDEDSDLDDDDLLSSFTRALDADLIRAIDAGTGRADTSSRSSATDEDDNMDAEIARLLDLDVDSIFGTAMPSPASPSTRKSSPRSDEDDLARAVEAALLDIDTGRKKPRR